MSTKSVSAYNLFIYLFILKCGQYHKDFIKKSHLRRSNTSVGLPDGGCPIGTVPIRRTKKEDNLEGEYVSDNLSYRAMVGTANFGGNKYVGARTNLSIYGPNVSPRQQSFGLMAVGNGPERIEAGWMVLLYLYYI